MANTVSLSPEMEALADSWGRTMGDWIIRLCESKDQQPASPKRMSYLRRKCPLTMDEAYELYSNESGFRPYLTDGHAMKLAAK